MATNEFGLDTSYFSENLSRLLRDIDRYTPGEMERALTRLADTARPSSRSPSCSKVDSFTRKAVAALRQHRFCGDCYPDNGWPGINEALAAYQLMQREKP